MKRYHINYQNNDFDFDNIIKRILIKKYKKLILKGGSYESDMEYDYGSDIEYLEELDEIDNVENYCQELTEIKSQIKNLNDLLSKVKDDLKKTESNHNNSHKINSEANQNKINSNIEISSQMEKMVSGISEQDRLNIQRRIVVLNQDIDYHDAQILDSLKDIQQNEIKLEELSKKKSSLNSNLETLNQNYQSLFDSCKEELDKIFEMEESFQEKIDNISLASSMNLRQIGEYRHLISKIKDPEKKREIEEMFRQIQIKDRKVQNN